MTSGIFLSTSLNRALSKSTVSTTADGTSPLEARTNSRYYQTITANF